MQATNMMLLAQRAQRAQEAQNAMPQIMRSAPGTYGNPIYTKPCGLYC
jgi:hypothetical protein